MATIGALDGWRIVAEDPAPEGFDFAVGGRLSLPAYTVYENTEPMPRAFVVPEARPLPEQPGVLAALAGTDFRRLVWLEGWDGLARPGGEGAAFRPAQIVDYRPNRVTLHIPPGPGGYLVLADVWYPGWRCRVDECETPIYRADYLFRAAEVSEGAHEVVFTFEPGSYQCGRAISLAALAGMALLAAGGFARTLGRKRSTRPTNEAC